MRDQSLSGFFISEAIEYRVKRLQWISGEIHLGYKSRQDACAEQRKVNMGRTPCVIVIAPGIWTGFYRLKEVSALIVRKQAASTGEIWILEAHRVHLPYAGSGLQRLPATPQ